VFAYHNAGRHRAATKSVSSLPPASSNSTSTRGAGAADNEVVMWFQFRNEFRLIDPHPLGEIIASRT
jgi:hypothetical protein